ncbi:MAG: CapA family protein [Candidatus Moranbacteria bacterium]|nr:CapA family protein [Candidatus Moranbacteria bacterium]
MKKREPVKNIILFILLAISGLLLAGLLIFLCWEEDLEWGGSQRESQKIGTESIGAQAENEKRDPEEKENRETASLVFAGDLMTDRYIRTVTERRGFEYILGEKVKDLLGGADCAVANLEGPITDFESKSQGTEAGSEANYYFTMPPETVEFLSEKNFCAVNIGNNHILNFGSKGLEQTKQRLEEAGVGYFGEPNKNEKTLIKEINGVKIALVSYNQFEFIDSGENIILSNIKKANKKANRVIVYSHWGEEYRKSADAEQKEMAGKFIDAGADLVIGSHSHVIGEEATHKGRKIYYSLGNFVFDQYFSAETQEGLLIKAVFSKKNELFKIDQFKVKMQSDGKTVLID